MSLFRGLLVNGKAYRKLAKKQLLVKHKNKTEDVSKNCSIAEGSLCRSQTARHASKAHGHSSQNEGKVLIFDFSLQKFNGLNHVAIAAKQLNNGIHISSIDEEHSLLFSNVLKATSAVLKFFMTQCLLYCKSLSFTSGIFYKPPTVNRRQVKIGNFCQYFSDKYVMKSPKQNMSLMQKVLEAEMMKREVIDMVRWFTNNEPIIEVIKQARLPAERMSVAFECLFLHMEDKFNLSALGKYLNEVQHFRFLEIAILLEDAGTERSKPHKWLVVQIYDIAMLSIKRHLSFHMSDDDTKRLFRHFKDNEHLLAVIGENEDNRVERFHAVFIELMKLGRAKFNPSLVSEFLVTTQNRLLAEACEESLRPVALLRQARRSQDLLG